MIEMRYFEAEIGLAAGRTLALRHYVLEAYNRRGQQGAIDAPRPTALARECMCTCTDRACRVPIPVQREDYEYVRESPHRTLVAPGHASAIHAVILRRRGYEIIEVLPPFRSENPRTIAWLDREATAEHHIDCWSTCVETGVRSAPRRRGSGAAPTV
jgi:hypothetical protein